MVLTACWVDGLVVSFLKFLVSGPVLVPGLDCVSGLFLVSGVYARVILFTAIFIRCFCSALSLVRIFVGEAGCFGLSLSMTLLACSLASGVDRRLTLGLMSLISNCFVSVYDLVSISAYSVENRRCGDSTGRVSAV